MSPIPRPAVSACFIDALCGDERLIDEYMAVLLRAVRENGLQQDRKTLNMLGTELVEAALLLWMIRFRPCGHDAADGLRPNAG